MNFKGKSSRSGSQSSRHSATQDEEPYFNAGDSSAHAEFNTDAESIQGNLDIDDEYRNDRYYQFTQNHPIGCILLKLVF